MKKYFSELRQDLVSGDWILVSPGRFRKVEEMLKKSKKRIQTPKTRCPFERPLETVSEKILLQYPENQKKKWSLLVLENGFPAVRHSDKKVHAHKEGPYAALEGAGHHDLLITRDHHKDFSALSKERTFEVFQAFRDRYLQLMTDRNVAYVSMFHNWGPKAGASVYHPHYQMIGIPVIPTSVSRSFEGSKIYKKKHGRCAHCDQIKWEKSEKKRMVGENEYAIAFTPYFSRNPFEIIVIPKAHRPFFENTLDAELQGVADLLRDVLKLLGKKLHDPDYNFFIHTSPIFEKKKFTHYHWHIEVYPKLSIRAGFEISTGIEINVADPDLVAKTLRKK